MGVDHGLEGRISALLRAGQTDARRRYQSEADPSRRRIQIDRRRFRHRRHVSPNPGGCIFRRARQDGARPVFRRRRTRAGRLHLLLSMHHWMPEQRQEHPRTKLPVPRRKGRRAGSSDDDRRRRSRIARRRLRGRNRPHWAAGAQTTPDLVRRSGGVLRGRARYPKPAPSTAGQRIIAADIGTVGRTGTDELRDQPRCYLANTHGSGPRRGRDIVDPPRCTYPHRGLPCREGQRFAVRAHHRSGRRRSTPPGQMGADEPAPSGCIRPLPQRPRSIRAIDIPARHAGSGQFADDLPQARAVWRETGLSTGQGRAQSELESGRP